LGLDPCFVDADLPDLPVIKDVERVLHEFLAAVMIVRQQPGEVQQPALTPVHEFRELGVTLLS